MGALSAAPDVFLLANRSDYDGVRNFLDNNPQWNVDTTNEYKSTVLAIAAFNGSQPLVDLMISRSANVDLPDALGRTPLMIAAENGSTGITRSLLAAHANTELMDDFGENPLLIAARKGHVEIVQSLLAASAKPDAKDTYGKTALMMATQWNHAAVVEVLQHACPGISIEDMKLRMPSRKNSLPRVRKTSNSSITPARKSRSAMALSTVSSANQNTGSPRSVSPFLSDLTLSERYSQHCDTPSSLLSRSGSHDDLRGIAEEGVSTPLQRRDSVRSVRSAASGIATPLGFRALELLAQDMLRANNGLYPIENDAAQQEAIQKLQSAMAATKEELMRKQQELTDSQSELARTKAALERANRRVADGQSGLDDALGRVRAAEEGLKEREREVVERVVQAGQSLAAIVAREQALEQHEHVLPSLIRELRACLSALPGSTLPHSTLTATATALSAAGQLVDSLRERDELAKALASQLQAANEQAATAAAYLADRERALAEKEKALEHMIIGQSESSAALTLALSGLHDKEMKFAQVTNEAVVVLGSAAERVKEIEMDCKEKKTSLEKREKILLETELAQSQSATAMTMALGYVKEVEANCGEKLRKLEKTERELMETRAQLGFAEERVVALQYTIDDKNRDLSESKIEMASLKRILEDMERRAKEAEQRLEVREAEIRQAEGRLREMVGGLDNAERRLWQVVEGSTIGDELDATPSMMNLGAEGGVQDAEEGPSQPQDGILGGLLEKLHRAAKHVDSMVMAVYGEFSKQTAQAGHVLATPLDGGRGSVRVEAVPACGFTFYKILFRDVNGQMTEVVTRYSDVRALFEQLGEAERLRLERENVGHFPSRTFLFPPNQKTVEKRRDYFQRMFAHVLATNQYEPFTKYFTAKAV